MSKATHPKVSNRFKFGVAAVMACFFACACSSPQKQISEAPPPPAVSTVEQPPPQVAALPPPQLNEVQDAVKRVFKDSVVMSATHSPNFIAADFNGDHSQDIAVVLMPVSGKLVELNEEFPTWILRDPFTVALPGSRRLRVADKEVLLGVIHGYGPNGWRDPQATQSYLLKNAAGSAMKAHPLSEFTEANQGRSLPRLHGDVVGEILDGRAGYLYYADATYSWYDPKTFKAGAERRMVHAPPAQPNK